MKAFKVMEEMGVRESLTGKKRRSVRCNSCGAKVLAGNKRFRIAYGKNKAVGYYCSEICVRSGALMQIASWLDVIASYGYPVENVIEEAKRITLAQRVLGDG